MGLVRKYIPPQLQPVFLRAVPLLKKLAYFGLSCYCPVCRSWLRSFKPHEILTDAVICCPVCGCLDRHRLDWIFLNTRTDLFDPRPKRVLHIAPEPEFETRLRRVKSLDYLSADLQRPAMVRMDITEIQFPPDSFDVIICCHVLEHVPDDRKAMSELYRVLRPGGWLLVQVPQPREITHTIEDNTVVEPDERRRLFGWPTHVRIYGPDLKERLEDAGFTARRFSWLDIVNERDGLRQGVKGQVLFHAKKQ